MSVVATLVLLTGAAFLDACSSAENTTGGRRVTLRTQIRVEPSAKAAFVTARGWNIALSRAVLSVGALYYFEGPPAILANRRPSHERLFDVFRLKRAYAHPGHYQQGAALGQAVPSTSLELFAQDLLEVAPGEGVTGTYRSAELMFVAPALQNDPALNAAVAALAEGQAAKDGVTKFFRGVVTFGEMQTATQGKVSGCEFSETQVAADGTVTLSVDPKLWFELVDFSELAPGSLTEPSVLPDGSQPKIAFVQGVAQISAYKLSYSHP